MRLKPKVVLYELVVTCGVVVCLMVAEVVALAGPNVCVQQQKYNITKRVKYRAPMSVRTYEWCLAMPPRCSRWSTEMRDLTRLETEERIADVDVCCPGYKIKDISCVPICPHGKTGPSCKLDCPPKKWGPNCVHDCKPCQEPSACSPLTGKCVCHDGWIGESCEIRMSTTTTTTTTTTQRTELLTTAQTTQTLRESTVPPLMESFSSTTKTTVSTDSTFLDVTTPLTTIKEKIETKTPSTLQPARTIVETSSTVMPSPTKSVITTKDSFYYRIPLKTNNESSPTIKLITETTKPEFMTTSPKSLPTETTMATTKPITRAPITETTRLETTRKTEGTPKFIPTTLKFKPKEIWIRPVTKGESSTVETRIKDFHARHRNATKKEIILLTTPKTILVSIIPTSLSYSLHKKISLSSTYHTPSQSIKIANQTEGVTESLSKSTNYNMKNHNAVSVSTRILLLNKTESTSTHLIPSTTPFVTTSYVQNSTNSMSTNGTNSSSITPAPTVLTTNISNLPSDDVTTEMPKTTAKTILTTAGTTILKLITTRTVERKVQATTATVDIEPNNLTKNTSTNGYETNTRATQSEEAFPILTEPEHITAIATDKAHERTSVDLISVLSIAGGVMFAVITVAVIIVMIERCRRPRYEDVRKMDDIRMKVLMDEEDLPPPYVRSIFHTPLPELPAGEKCHYQPLSTLDRNLKQFMRPVVVQTISPIMIENFRGILECHYDHLPRRSHAFDSSQCDLRCSLAPSVSSATEPLCSRATSMIDASKCEAKLDEIDSTTSEPLYAEIPAWRPPSEHAIEVVNMNGEACTEL